MPKHRSPQRERFPLRGDTGESTRKGRNSCSSCYGSKTFSHPLEILAEESVSVATSVAIMANVGNDVGATQTDRQPLQGSSLSRFVNHLNE